MKPISITEIVSASGGTLVAPSSEGGAAVVRKVSTDTRNISEGSLFVALRGDRFDGHDYAMAAAEKGASCLMLDALPEGCDSLPVPVVLVEDTLLGLQRLARWYRQLLDIQVVGITGSNGKTSVKDFTRSVLSQKFKVNATRGNFNNHIGLPLSVLETEGDDEVCILEMGMNHAGEIAPLCEIAQPNIGIITNIGTAHIEFLGSRDAIAEEKSALGRSLSDRGVLIVTADCDYADYLIKHTQAHVIVAGNGRGTVRAEALKMTDSGSSFNLCIDGEDSVPVEISVSGRHMVSNALLAASAGHALGMNIKLIAQGLNQAVLTSGRLRRYTCEGVHVIDDTYNANPDSVVAAIDTLSELNASDGARRVIALGVMAELGEHAEKEHLRVGKLAAERGLLVVSVGDGAQKIHEGACEVTATPKWFADHESAARFLSAFCREGDLVLFKGSRTAGMERVMQQAFPES